MDRNSQNESSSTDAFVEVKVRKAEDDYWTHRTQTCKKSLNPEWKSEFVVEVMNDSILQDAPIEFKVMDQDLYSNETIGSVFIDLNPLIMRTAHVADSKDSFKDPLVIKGSFPIFDTLQGQGMRGTLQISIKLQFIGNDNPFRDSSAGVQFVSSSSLNSSCFIIDEFLGFVVDLVSSIIST